MLDCALCGETVDNDGAGLADAVGAVLGLQVLLRVPVRVEEDDRVGGREIYPLAAGAGAEEEDAAGWIGVEGVDLGAAVGLGDRAVDTAGFVSREGEGGPFFEDVELGGELGEEEDFVGVC